MGVASGCGCKAVYRFSYYLSLLLEYLFFFAAASLLFGHLKKCFSFLYKDRWEAAVGKLLTCSKESTNVSDRYPVAVIKDRTTIGHLQRKMCKVYSVFLRRGGLINCKVTGLKCSLSKYPDEKKF